MAVIGTVKLQVALSDPLGVSDIQSVDISEALTRLPAGFDLVPRSATSLTVAVQVLVGEALSQDIAVEVVRLRTPWAKPPALGSCVESPPYMAPIVSRSASSDSDARVYLKVHVDWPKPGVRAAQVLLLKGEPPSDVVMVTEPVGAVGGSVSSLTVTIQVAVSLTNNVT
jgi:hypothetical protein